MSEETKSADRSAPWGIILAIGTSAVVGWGYILALLFSIQVQPLTTVQAFPSDWRREKCLLEIA